MQPAMTTAEENKALARRTIEEFWNQGNLNFADEIIASDYVRIEIGSPVELRGVEGAKQAAAKWRVAFPDMHLTIDDLIAEGDKLACHWTFTGTHQGELEGIAPTSRKVRTSGIAIVSYTNGKVVEEIVSLDALGLMKQLGVILE